METSGFYRYMVNKKLWTKSTLFAKIHFQSLQMLSWFVIKTLPSGLLKTTDQNDQKQYTGNQFNPFSSKPIHLQQQLRGQQGVLNDIYKLKVHTQAIMPFPVTESYQVGLYPRC
jgi:hypothetical protein